MPSTGALDRFPNILPQQLTSFIGRERELQDLKGLLERSRLLTLTGPGGSGKTRLGLQLAAEVTGGFPDGVYFVALAPVGTRSWSSPRSPRASDCGMWATGLCWIACEVTLGGRGSFCCSTTSST